MLSLIGFFLSYNIVLALLALFVPVRKTFPVKRQRRLAVVIPAHDEEWTVEKSILSVRSSLYPAELFDVVVIADNCTDRTVHVARNIGAHVIERFSKTRKGKGYALQLGFEHLLEDPRQYEGYIVIDADSVISENFLSVMNWYLEQGHQSIQAVDIVAPNPESWSSEVSRISLTLYNYVRPMGRKAIGCSAGLRGNGMCFSAGLLRAVPWQAHSLTEDLEYGLILLQKGISSVFAPEATVFATMPEKSKNAESQRTRWEAGRFPVMKKYVPMLFRSALKERSWVKVDSLIDLLTPAFVNMMGAVILFSATKFMFSWLKLDLNGLSVGWWDALFLIGILYVAVGLVAAKADVSLYKAVVYFPLYLLWKMKLYIKLFLTGISKDWVRTTREHH